MKIKRLKAETHSDVHAYSPNGGTEAELFATYYLKRFGRDGA